VKNQSKINQVQRARAGTLIVINVPFAAAIVYAKHAKIPEWLFIRA
jgi:hypothetical protein